MLLRHVARQVAHVQPCRLARPARLLQHTAAVIKQPAGRDRHSLSAQAQPAHQEPSYTSVCRSAATELQNESARYVPWPPRAPFCPCPSAVRPCPHPAPAPCRAPARRRPARPPRPRACCPLPGCAAAPPGAPAPCAWTAGSGQSAGSATASGCCARGWTTRLCQSWSCRRGEQKGG